MGSRPALSSATFCRVGVHAENVEPKAGHARGVGDAEVAGPQHGEPHAVAHEPGHL